MRHVGLAFLLVSMPLFAQTKIVRPARPATFLADNAESALKQAMDQFGALKQACERDVSVLAHVRAADAALTDPMQPSNAVQKAWEELETAKQQQPDFVVYQGIVKAEREVENAKLSPMTADFPHLRVVLRDNALGPAARVVVRDASSLQAESMAWLHVQQLIGDHVRALSEVTAAALKASDQQ
jgi:hypothetical protein